MFSYPSSLSLPQPAIALNLLPQALCRRSWLWDPVSVDHDRDDIIFGIAVFGVILWLKFYFSGFVALSISMFGVSQVLTAPVPMFLFVFTSVMFLNLDYVKHKFAMVSHPIFTDAQEYRPSEANDDHHS